VRIFCKYSFLHSRVFFQIFNIYALFPVNFTTIKWIDNTILRSSWFDASQKTYDLLRDPEK